MIQLLFSCLLASLAACKSPLPISTTANLTQSDFETKISEMEDYLEYVNIYPDVSRLMGNTLKDRQKWRQYLINTNSIDLVSRGISPTQLKVVSGDDNKVWPFLRRQHGLEFLEPSDKTRLPPISVSNSVSNSMALSEIVVIATVDRPAQNVPDSFAGPGAYEIKIEQRLKGDLPHEPIAVLNAFSPHSRILMEGMECIFFLSPTRTKYRQIYNASFPYDQLDDTVMAYSEGSYCANEDDVFSEKSYSRANANVTREEVMALANAYK